MAIYKNLNDYLGDCPAKDVSRLQSFIENNRFRGCTPRGENLLERLSSSSGLVYHSISLRNAGKSRIISTVDYLIRTVDNVVLLHGYNGACSDPNKAKSKKRRVLRNAKEFLTDEFMGEVRHDNTAALVYVDVPFNIVYTQQRGFIPTTIPPPMPQWQT